MTKQSMVMLKNYFKITFRNILRNKGYTYRIEPGIRTFILAGSISLITAIFAISYHVIKAAFTNPVDSLMYE
jgi:hypothetical protein